MDSTEEKKPSTIEDWAKERGTPDWLFAATKAAHRWGQGKELDVAAYDAAVERTANFKYHAYDPGPPKPSLTKSVDAAPAEEPRKEKPFAGETVAFEDRPVRRK